MLTAPDGLVTLVAWVMRKLPVEAVSTVQLVVAPRPVGWATRVEEALVKPVGVVQAPEAVVQA